MNYNRIFLLILTSINFSAKISANHALTPTMPAIIPMENQITEITKSEAYKQFTEIMSHLADLHKREREKIYEKYREEIEWIKDHYETNQVQCERLLFVITREFENSIKNSLNDDIYYILNAMNTEYNEEQKISLGRLASSLSLLAMTYELTQMCGIKDL